jgi:hypothetical protein
LAILVGSLSAAEIRAQNQLRADERQQGWELLFDGFSSKGWV